MAARLGMGKAALDPLTRAPYEQAQRKLRELKANLKRRFKRAALELHPDHNQDDPKAADNFKLLIRVRKILEDIHVEPPRRARPSRPAPKQPFGETFDEWMQAMQRDMEDNLKRRTADMEANLRRQAAADERARKRQRANPVDKPWEGKVKRPTPEDVRMYGTPEPDPVDDMVDALRYSMGYYGSGIRFTSKD